MTHCEMDVGKDSVTWHLLSPNSNKWATIEFWAPKY